MVIIGFTLYGQDNDSYMLEDENRPDAPTCPKCGFIKDFNSYHNPFFKVKKKTYDFSHPYDIGHIVSLKFKEFCLREQYIGVLFKEFEREPNFYQLVVNNIVEFDIVRRKPELVDLCPVCKNYKEAIGSLPTFLKDVQKELPDGFYRSDLFFGEDNKKHPLIVVAPTTAEKLKREKMKGLIFEPIYL
jgi:hypothetical protein